MLGTAHPKVGVIFKSYERLASITAYARHADALGLEGGFWIAEAYPWFRQFGYETRGAMVSAAVAAMATSRIPVGLGTVSPYMRHPSIQAAEAAALDELTEGRFIMGLSAGRVGTNFLEPDLGDKPTVRIHRESIAIFREAVGGRKFQFVGQFFAASMPGIAAEQRGHRHSIPVYVGGIGTKMQVLAGEIGDGLLMPEMTTPEFIRGAVQNIAEGQARRPSKPDAFPIGAALLCSIARNGAKARDGVRPLVATYIVDKFKNAPNNPMLLAAPVAKADMNALRTAVLAGRKDFTPLLTDTVLRRLSIVAGTPDDAREIMQELIDAGLNLLLMEMTGVDEDAIHEGMTLLAQDVIPHLKPAPRRGE